jgi:hypothetical protein
MTITADNLDTAAFPEAYAEILIDTLAITAANVLNVKDALNGFRRLDDGQADDALRHIATGFSHTANPSNNHVAAREPPLTPLARYFRGASGRCYTYPEIADRIRKDAPHTLGKHIFEQLEAIGLLQEIQNGSTPCGLPFTFADALGPIQKQLTSNGLIHTPGIFRALQNDYRIKGKPRRRPVKILSEGYGLPAKEAEGLLSGAIKIAVDESAGTITYTLERDHPPTAKASLSDQTR